MKDAALPRGASAEDVAEVANMLFRLREEHVLALAKRFPKRAARFPSASEYAEALLEHIEDFAFYQDRQRPGFLDVVLQYEAAVSENDVRTMYGPPVNRKDIAEYLNWQIQRLMPAYDSVMDAAIAVRTSFENFELLEMPWCPCPGAPDIVF